MDANRKLGAPPTDAGFLPVRRPEWSAILRLKAGDTGNARSGISPHDNPKVSVHSVRVHTIENGVAPRPSCYQRDAFPAMTNVVKGLSEGFAQVCNLSDPVGRSWRGCIDTIDMVLGPTRHGAHYPARLRAIKRKSMGETRHRL